MKNICFILILSIITFTSCRTADKKASAADRQMAGKIKSEFLRSWNAYKTYAWGHDALLPVSKSHMDWYENSLGISPIDAYSTMKIFNRRSSLGLVAENINVQTGLWVDSVSHIGCCIDSYYEYLLKGAILFNDEDLRKAWDVSIAAIRRYVAEEVDTSLWFGTVNKETGERVNRTATLYDAYFPAVLALSGDMKNAARYLDSWNKLWQKNGLEPMVYDYGSGEILHPAYNLNPEIIESAYYLYYFTGDAKYKEMAAQYFEDIMTYCRTDVAFTNIKDVRTKEQKDHMETFFLAETMKYLYLVFANPEGINPKECVFSTEAHPFKM